MKSRQKGLTQEAAAARTGISTRSGRSIEHHGRKPKPRHWRTRPDPLTTVWDEHLLPLLEREPELTGLTLLEYLQDGHFQISMTKPYCAPCSVVSDIGRPCMVRRRMSSFAKHHSQADKGCRTSRTSRCVSRLLENPYNTCSISSVCSMSGWRYVLAIQGGESYPHWQRDCSSALSRLGGCPQEHRTDSLSAAFNNKDDQLRTCYAALCDHYHMTATRNNKGISHENGAIEAPHGSLKRRLSQALKVRGSGF